MLSPQLRNKVHGLWSMFWAAGMTNPLVAIEQITYLLFLRQLEQVDEQRKQAGKATIYGQRVQLDAQGKPILGKNKKPITVDYDVCRWSYIRQNVSFDLLNQTVFPWLRELETWLAKNSQSSNEQQTGEQQLKSDAQLSVIAGRLSDAHFILDKNKSETLERAVKEIHELFNHVGGANADIMGDIFEYLLGEIQTAGKNGQFRTPRHIIRFMIELLDPPPTTNGQPTKILDPACGTGGFLVNTLIHWKKQATPKETLRLEWDGTPHRTFGTLPEELDPNDCFYGYDNDRTMVRIAWMNLILHDLDFPKIDQLDSLSKRMPDSLSGTFDYILANPPFTGNVDESDLSTNRDRVDWKGKKPLTTKSELLFVWMMLDLLRVGGRCAVVVPDGVLFGSTNAHIELRRKLLFENTLEGVVSLPGGVFNPYSGVKTSILVFKKVGDEPKAGREPRTKEVWFYEVAEEAKTLDQRRNDRPGQNNDLYDASEKFHSWYEIVQGSNLPNLREAAISAKYHQPKYWKERWRVIDDEFLRIFPEEESQKGHALSLHEIFTDLPDKLDKFLIAVSFDGMALLDKLTLPFVRSSWESAAREKTKAKKQSKAEDELKNSLKKLSNEISKLNKDKSYLENEYDKFGFSTLKADLASAGANRFAQLVAVAKGTLDPAVFLSADDSEQLLEQLLKCYARLDGYEIWMRSVEVRTLPEKLTKSESSEPSTDVLAWFTPVRAWLKAESWKDTQSEKAVQKPTHDKEGLVDPSYVKWLMEECSAFNEDGTVKPEYLELLDPDCIEAADLNLSAGRHKPFAFSARQHNRPDDLIRKLDKVHEDIRNKLAVLLEMVGGSR